MKYIRILGLIITFAILFLVVRQAYLYFGRGTISVSAKPVDAKIVVDNKIYSTAEAQAISLSPGEHTLTIALDGFNTIQQTVTMGWQDEQAVTYQLTPKTFKQIYQNLSPDPSYTTYEVAQPKFFLNNTWAAAYIIDGGEGKTISVAVIQRRNGAWRLVFHDHEIPADAQATLPPDVYNHIKDFEE